MSTAVIEEKLQGFIDKVLLRGHGLDLTSTTPLFDYGILDSFALFRIIAFITEEFGVTLPLESLRAEDFATIGSMTAFIESKIARA